MRSNNLFILCLITVNFALAQQHSIRWLTPQKSINGAKTLRVDEATIQDNLPIITTNLLGKYIINASFKNTIFEPLTDAEIKLLPKSFIVNDNIEIKITHGKAKDKWISSLSFIPLRKKDDVWEKLISYDYDLKTGTSQNLSKMNNYPWKDKSVFSEGEWYKIAVLTSGIHKIDFNFIKEQVGVNPATIDPRKIKMYGNGGGMLPQKNANTWYDDVDENAIFVSGENDGKFDDNDYILFYAQGNTEWNLSNNSNFQHSLNRYSDTTYYFINLNSDGNGKRVQPVDNVTGATASFDYYDAYDFYEKEDVNLVKSGRNWYGDKFDFELQKSYTFNTQGIRSTPGLTITARLAGISKIITSFNLQINNQNLGTVTVGNYSNDNYPTAKINTFVSEPFSTLNNNQTITITYDKGSSSASVGYLDFIRLNYQRNLALYGNQTSFRVIESLNHSISEFVVSNTNSNVRVWDVTSITNVKSQNYLQEGTSLRFSTPTSELKEFIVFSGTTFPSPVHSKSIKNQNLHTLAPPDFLIVTHRKFASEAERLARHRAENDGYSVEVIDVNHVYNEFSSGKKDPTAIRNLAKMFYDRNPLRFKYLLLMGDCSYDYKDRKQNNTDYVPVYESYNSEDPITSHSSDDYFALLDDEEGEWCTSCSFAEYLDIGVGRIPAKTLEEAKGVIDKIIHYDSEKENIDRCTDVSTFTSAKWKNDVVLIADDADRNIHFNSAEIIDRVMDNYPEFRVDKIYIDAFEQISGAGGQTAPAAKTAINQKMERGALIFNYSGHGGELGLSHEGVIDVNQIRNWRNFNNMPLMFTATCEFGRYDDPERTSAGEYTLLNDKGGVVGIVTTTRPVYSSQNNAINRAFFGSVFMPLDSVSGQMPRLGDVMQNAKNASSSSNNVNNRNFALLGDPSMRLAYPKENVIITSINTHTLTNEIKDTISALGKVTMTGEVRNTQNQLINNFNGIVEVSVFDKLSTYTTLGDEDGFPAEFQQRDVKIFEGLATVTNGKFTFTFIVPKDINYTFGTGKVMFYAASDNLKVDANGSNERFIVGGTAKNVEQDNTPPEINLFMNDENFVFGGTTNESPFLLAKLFDENGINTTGVGIGHEITSILNDKSENAIVLNEFYTTELDDYQRGVVKYPFEKLTPGRHKIEVKAWDTHNNSSREILEFIVVNDADIVLNHILNYPNPFTTNTTFHFDHNRYCDELQVMIQIYTISGKLIKTIQQDFPHAPAHISGINWDGKDDFGQNIGRGVYVYKVKVRSLTDDAQAQEYQKLVILK